MDNNIVVKQVQAVFRFLMSLFYIGAGIFLIFFADNFEIDKAFRNLIGIPFLLYGTYRVYTSLVSLYKLIIKREDDDY